MSAPRPEGMSDELEALAMDDARRQQMNEGQRWLADVAYREAKMSQPRGNHAITFDRVWAMPSSATFSIAPIGALLSRYIDEGHVVVDPFCGTSTLATHRNDLREANGQDAEAFCVSLIMQHVSADVVLFDPPYSPRQISEVYKSIGLKAGMEETQNARLYKRVRDPLAELLKVGGIAISCGWNSAGFGRSRGFDLLEILLVAHGGAHNDTIVTVERKLI